MPHSSRPLGGRRVLAAATGVALAAATLAFVNPTAAQAADPIDIQIIGTNDFHGRLVNESSGVAGAAILSGAVKELRAENPNTHFVAAGDLIGASTFESFIQQDVPTIDALNEAGLDVSAVGNHELDQGFDDLHDRVQGLAEWEYIVANLRLKADNTHALAPTWTEELGGVTVGYVGAVTEELPALVSPEGISMLDVTDIVDEVNASAADLVADGADVVVMLVHEGSPSTDCTTMDDSGAWADIINNVSNDVNAIVSGHTHLAYNCKFPVAGLSHERPVVSSGQYGTNLNQLVFTVDPDDGAISGVTQEILALETDPDGSGPVGFEPNYPADPAVETIVADAVAEADVLGAAELGDISAPLDRARWAEPDNNDEGTDPQVVENRGGESALGNLVAEVQRWATEPEEFGGAEIAFMNPGGLRANMTGPTVTYKQAAGVQPFANTLVNMDLTGAQIKTVLEQQWQRDSQGRTPSRPFLRLGVSEGFEYSYEAAAAEGTKITGMWLDGTPIDPATTYSVTVNSFLASGGDNFREFANGANKRDTGQIDLQAMVDYMEEFASETPLAVDFSQRSIGAMAVGDEIRLSSLSMTGANDVKDTEVEVFDGETSLGTFPVTSDLPGTPFDESGTAIVPNPDPLAPHTLRVVGDNSGTDAIVEVALASDISGTAEPAPATYGADWTVDVAVTPAGATGSVEVFHGATSLGTAPLVAGAAEITIDGTAVPAGNRTLSLRYLGNDTYSAAENPLEVTVAKAASTTSGVTVEPEVAVAGQDQVSMTATVSATGYTPTGEVQFELNGFPIGTAALEEGTATLVGGPLNAAGTFEITASYLGDGNTEGSSAAEGATLKVVKAAADTTVKVKPNKIRVNRTQAKVIVKVTSGDAAAKGRVEVKVGGKSYRAKLNDGRAVVKLKPFAKTGKKTVRVKYLGNAITKPDTAKATFRVVRK